MNVSQQGQEPPQAPAQPMPFVNPMQQPDSSNATNAAAPTEEGAAPHAMNDIEITITSAIEFERPCTDVEFYKNRWENFRIQTIQLNLDSVSIKSCTS